MVAAAVQMAGPFSYVLREQVMNNLRDEVDGLVVWKCEAQFALASAVSVAAKYQHESTQRLNAMENRGADYDRLLASLTEAVRPLLGLPVQVGKYAEKCDAVACLTERLATRIDAPRPSPLAGIAELLDNQSAQILIKVDSIATLLADRIALLEAEVAGLRVSDACREPKTYVIGSPGPDAAVQKLDGIPDMPPDVAEVDLVPARFGCSQSWQEAICIEVSLDAFEVCRFDGNCLRGDECWFRHPSADPRAELRRLSVASANRPEKRKAPEEEEEEYVDNLNDVEAEALEAKYAEECCAGCGFHPSMGCASACPTLRKAAGGSQNLLKSKGDEPACAGEKNDEDGDAQSYRSITSSELSEPIPVCPTVVPMAAECDNLHVTQGPVAQHDMSDAILIS